MSNSKRSRAGLATVVAALVAIALTAVPAAATKTVNVPSSLKISPYGTSGKVTAANPACVAERTVVLKEKGHGVLGRANSSETGKWEINPEGIKYKGPLPFKIYAELKPKSEGAAGTIYKCGAATSKTIEIAGG
ncbi:MAG TPA: hypothetical protein VII45_13565 [Solirubrobacterales bacterium]